MDIKNTIILTVAAAFVVAVGVLLLRASELPQMPQPLSGLASPDVFSYFNVRGVFTQGGGVFATTSIGASTLSMGDIREANLIERSGASAITITLPASTTISGLDAVGSTRTIYLANIGTGAVTLAGGSGTLLDSASTTAIGAGGIGRLDFVRKSNTDLVVFFNHGI